MNKCIESKWRKNKQKEENGKEERKRKKDVIN
jgi:hypothetical protein